MATFDLTIPEQWYPIRDFPAYDLSSHLRLRSRHAGPKKHCNPNKVKVIKIHTDDRGYRKLVLWRDGRYHNVYLHHVVAELAFGPKQNPEDVVRHLDDDKSNNWPPNLAYGTQTENVADCKRNGHFAILHGEERSNAIFTDQIVRAVRVLHGYGIATSVLAEALDMPTKRLYPIITGERWSHVED